MQRAPSSLSALKGKPVRSTIIDRIMKCLALAIAATWVFIYWEKRDDGRYLYPDSTNSGYTVLVFDSRTGTVYAADSAGAWIEMHPQTGLTIPHKFVVK
jgi:hypothetical protein